MCHRLCLCVIAFNEVKSTFRIGVLGLLLCAQAAWCYEGETHQRMTFVAARQFNLCAPEAGLPVLTPLQVRYIARSSVKEAGSRVVRSFRWGFYEREAEKSKHLFWLVQTRLHARLERLTTNALEAGDLLEYYSVIGQLMTHLQDMSVPVYVVPIYFSRFWRLSMRDRLSIYPIDSEALTERLESIACDALLDDVGAPSELVSSLADETINAIQETIPGQAPATWEAFWRFGREGRFGRYGPARNRFGERTDFQCGEQTCVFLADDPLYRDFASDRHLDALRSSLRLMQWAQQQQP